MAAPSALHEVKRRLAETLARSRLDYTDDILILNAFFRDFRWQEGASPEDVRGLWEKWKAQGQPPSHMLSVYLHIPYCVKKCHFCYCSTEITANPAVIDAYIPELKREIEYFAPLFKGMPVRLFQVGGGTPNILSAAQLRDLLGFARQQFSIDPDGMGVIEFNPAGTDREKLLVAREAGFNRISFGVQSLNEQVLARENREYQSFEMVREALRAAVQAGFEITNVDLLLGLASETAESFLDGFEKIASLHPTTIIVPGVTMTDAYLNVMGLTREQNHKRYEALLPRALEGLRALCERYGYATDHLTPNRGIWVLYAKDTPAPLLEKISRGDHFAGGGLSILGLGRQARSFLFGRGVCERYASGFSAGKPVYRLARMSPKEEMMRYILYALENHSRVDSAAFEERFGESLRSRFGLELRALAALGKIRPDREGFAYLPVGGVERIFYGLFFMLDLLAQSSFSAGKLDGGLLRRLKKEMAGVETEAASA